MFEHLVPLVMLFWKVVEPLESRVWMEEVGHEGVSLGFLKSTYLCRTAKIDGLKTPVCHWDFGSSLWRRAVRIFSVLHSLAGATEGLIHTWDRYVALCGSS